MSILNEFLKSVEIDRKNVEGTGAKRIPWTHNTKKLAIQALQAGYQRKFLMERTGINGSQFTMWQNMAREGRIQAANAVAYSRQTKNPRQDPFPDLTVEQILNRIKANKKDAEDLAEMSRQNAEENKRLRKSLNIKVSV